MRLLLVSPYFPPQRGAASVRVWSFAHQAVQAGIHTTVLTTTKHPDQIESWTDTLDADIHEIDFAVPKPLKRLRSAQKIDAPAKAPSSSQSFLSKSIANIRTRTGIYSSVRMPDLTGYWVNPATQWANRSAAKTNSTANSTTNSTDPYWDVVLSSGGPYTAHLVAMNLKKSGIAKSWVADFRDLWTANHAFKGLFPFTRQERRLENQVLTHADALTTVSDPLAQWLSAHSVAPVKVIYNGFGEPWRPTTSTPNLDPTSPIKLAYTGQLYAKYQDPKPILSAIATLHAQGIDITLTIAGASSACWTKYAEQAGVLDALNLLGEVSHDQALNIQRNAHALLAFEWKDPHAGVLTNKLFEYISAGPPILLTGHQGPMTHILNRTRRGINLGHTPQQAQQTLQKLLNGKQSFPLPNPDEITKLSRSEQSKNMIRLCQNLVS